MDQHRDVFRLSSMCRVLKVNRSGYYAWKHKPLSQRAQSDAVLRTAIEQSFNESAGIYGSPRVHRDLRETGWQCGENRVARLMRQAHLKSLRGYRKPRFKSGKPAVAAPNRLQQQFTVPCADRAWVTDITYIRTYEGWLYLAVVIDLYSRAVIGWSMQPTMKTELVLDALLMAVWAADPSSRLSFTPIRVVSLAVTISRSGVPNISWCPA